MKKVLIAMCIIIPVLLCVAAILYLVPISSTFQEALNCTQIDENGNPVKSVEIAIQVIENNYLFQEDSFGISIAPFDNLTSIQVAKNSDGILKPVSIGEEFFTITFSAVDTSTQSPVFGKVIYSKGYEYWAFSKMEYGKETYYVASSKGAHPTQEIIQHFNGLVPGYKSE